MESKKRSFWWVVIFVLTLGVGGFYAWSVKKSMEGDKKEVKDYGVKLSSRLEKIVSLAKEMGTIKTSDVKKVVGDVTNRTIRRDMDKLVEMEIVRKVGNTRGSSYEYIG